MVTIVGLILAVAAVYFGVKCTEVCDSLLEKVFVLVLTAILAGLLFVLSLFWFFVVYI